jgi:hypothetical protein
MADTARTVAVGIFNNQTLARQAVLELRRCGFAEDQIGFITREADTRSSSSLGRETATGGGAAVGVAAGAGLGALWGLAAVGSVLVPGIGAVAAGGSLLAGLLVGTAGGATLGGALGALLGLGITEDRARFYEEQLRVGQTLIAVQAGERLDEAAAILQRYGGYDAEGRHAEAPLQPSVEYRAADAALAAAPPSASVLSSGPSQAEEGVQTRREPLTQGGSPTTIPMLEEAAVAVAEPGQHEGSPDRP